MIATFRSEMNQLFERRRKHSLYWYNKSTDLRGAAASVWVGISSDIAPIVVERTGLGPGFSMAVATGPVYGMLCGMSLELAFKAITVERGELLNEKTHDLLEHLKTTRITYTKKERALLKIFSHAATWDGRYPVPKKENAWDDFQDLCHKNLYDPVRSTEKPEFIFKRSNGALGWEGFSNLWEKASHHYFKAREAGQAYGEK